VQVDRWRQVVSWAAGLFICKHGKTKNGISESIARGWINDLDIKLSTKLKQTASVDQTVIQMS